MQVSEEELEQYIASQQQAGQKLPGITLAHTKPQVGYGLSGQTTHHTSTAFIQH